MNASDKVVVPAGRAKKIIKKIIQNDPKTVLFLVGGPGVGKSAICSQVAEELKIGYKETFLLTRNPVDFGVPFPDEERRYAKLLPLREIFPRPEVDGKEGLWLLDEMSSAPPAVQAVAQRIIWDRKIENETIPDRWVIIAAGNRITDKGVVYQLPSPLAGRFTRLEIEPDLDDWIEHYALPRGVDHRIISSLRVHPDTLYAFDPSKYQGGAFPSPRGWEKVNRKLKNIGHEDEDFYAMIAGDIGLEATNKFVTFLRVYSKLPKVEDVLEGKVTFSEGDDRSILFALTGNVVQYVAEHKKDSVVVEKFLVNVILNAPAVFATLMMKDIMRVGMKPILTSHIESVKKISKKLKIFLD